MQKVTWIALIVRRRKKREEGVKKRSGDIATRSEARRARHGFSRPRHIFGVSLALLRKARLSNVMNTEKMGFEECFSCYVGLFPFLPPPWPGQSTLSAPLPWNSVPSSASYVELFFSAISASVCSICSLSFLVSSSFS